MRAGVSVVAVVLLVGCFRPVPYKPQRAELDPSEIDAWISRYEAVRNDRSAEAARKRARLALTALTWDLERASALQSRWPDYVTLSASGRADLTKAVEAVPIDPEALALEAEWKAQLEHDWAGSARAACKAADLLPTSVFYEICGDAWAQAGDRTRAGMAYRKAILVTEAHDRRLRLLGKLEKSADATANEREASELRAHGRRAP